MDLFQGTTYVKADEPCMGLYEMNLRPPHSKVHKRYQIIHVIRNGKITEYRESLGLAKKFKADQFRVPGGVIDQHSGRISIEHTVGELKDIADYLRLKPMFDKLELVGVNKIKG